MSLNSLGSGLNSSKSFALLIIESSKARSDIKICAQESGVRSLGDFRTPFTFQLKTMSSSSWRFFTRPEILLNGSFVSEEANEASFSSVFVFPALKLQPVCAEDRRRRSERHTHHRRKSRR